MFDLIKQQVNLIEVLERDLNVSFRLSGDRTWVIDGDEDVEACPFCQHHDCFKVSYSEGDNASAFYKCFSCDASGDVITWKAKESKLSMGEAARLLAKEYHIKLPNDYNPMQQIFNLATDYYHGCLVETCNKPYAVLNGLTPLKYQLDIRGHKMKTLLDHKIGFSDGGLVEYLDSLGVDPDLVKQSGLINKAGKDFLPSSCFIYTGFVKGKPSHFTFKDPTKKLQYQLPKKNSLNGFLFYGQDAIQNASSIALVEGENDWLSLVENGGDHALAMLGQISGEQLDWLRLNCKDKIILTLFDPDDAGDKYREKLELLRRYFKHLIHVKPPDSKDIDKHLSSGVSLVDLIRDNQVKVVVTPKGTSPSSTDVVVIPQPWDEVIKTEVTVVGPATPSDASAPGEEVSEVVDDNEAVEVEGSPVFLWKRCYYKYFYKDGVRDITRISDFFLELKNIILDEEIDDRRREVIVKRMDGTNSRVVEIDSATKISTLKFKEKMAQVVDAEWLGKEADLDSMWRFVYNKYPEVTIQIVRQVGRSKKHKCWLFRNILITDSGKEITPDENGVFWVSGRTHGIKIKDIVEEDNGSSGVPILRTDMPREKSEALLKSVVENLSIHMGGMGPALMALGWTYSNIYSDDIHKEDGGFGSLMIWGTHGTGKSTIARWLQDFYGLTDKMGSTSVPQLKKAVGFNRKGAFYASIPLMLDEVKADDETNKHLGMIRAWYDREPRTIAQKDANMVRNLPVRSTLLMSGEDLPADPATRERCIMLRVPPAKDEEIKERDRNYEMLKDSSHMFSNITYYWIKDAVLSDKKEVFRGIREMDQTLVTAGCTNRISKVWSSAGYFAKVLAEKYCPEFNFPAYITEACIKEQKQQREDNTLSRFYSSIATLRAREKSLITDQHIFRSGKELHIWFSAVYFEVNREVRDSEGKWSKLMVIRAIKEEPYFVSDSRKINMGLNGVRKVVMTLDLDKCPEVLQMMMEYTPKIETENVVVS